MSDNKKAHPFRNAQIAEELENSSAILLSLVFFIKSIS